MDESAHGVPRLRLEGFPAGPVTVPTLAADAAYSLAPSPPLGQPDAGVAHAIAPEMLRGGIPTTAADIYALGILLYQMVAADLARPLAAGWEADVKDELLRRDIALAAAGDRTRRLSSAAQLAELLETLSQRHLLLRQQMQLQESQTRLSRQIERHRARRPWIIGAAVSALAGILISTMFAIRSVQERNLADRRAALEQAVNTFMTEDLLGRGNPAQSGKADETLMEAATAAEASIDRRLSSDPLTAGAIYLSLADAFTGRTNFSAATNAYQRAIDAFRAAGPQGVAPAVIAQLRLAAMLIMSVQPQSIDQASALIAAAGPRTDALGSRRVEATVWLHNAIALQQMLGGDMRVAQVEFGKAADGADALPHVFDEATRLTFRRREAFAYLRLGDWPAARTMMSALLVRQRAVSGVAHPDTLQLELNLGQVDIVLHDPAAALATLNRIYPDFVTVFGPSHRLTLGLLGERANALENLGRYAQAYADQIKAYQISAATEGPSSFMALGSLTDAAASRCRAGQPDQGLNQARMAYAGAELSFGTESPLAQAARGNLALCMIAAGQFDAAHPLLDKIDSQIIARLTLDQTYGARVDLLRAAMLLHDGNLEAGQSLLRKVAPTFAAQNADPYLRQLTFKMTAEFLTKSTK